MALSSCFSLGWSLCSLPCPSVRRSTGVPLGPSPRVMPGARSTTHTPIAPVSTPAACFLGISGCAEPGAQVFSALGREGRSSAANSQPCLCFLFTSEGGWGPRGLRPALWSEASQAVRGVISPSAQIGWRALSSVNCLPSLQAPCPGMSSY